MGNPGWQSIMRAYLKQDIEEVMGLTGETKTDAQLVNASDQTERGKRIPALLIHIAFSLTPLRSISCAE